MKRKISKKFIKNGVHVTELTEAEHQVFFDEASDIRAYFIEKYGAEACDAWGIKK